MVYQEPEPKICALPKCGQMFWTKKENQRFHSNECRVEFQRSVLMGICPHCGKELLRAKE